MCIRDSDVVVPVDVMPIDQRVNLGHPEIGILNGFATGDADRGADQFQFAAMVVKVGGNFVGEAG